MVCLNIEGRNTKVTEEYALSWALSYMVSTFDIISNVHWALSFGMPPSSTTRFIALLGEAVDVLNDNSPVVDEPLLSQSIDKLLPSLASFVESTNAIIRWEKVNVHQGVKKEHERVSRTSGPTEPPWLEDGEVQAYFESMNSSYGVYVNSLDLVIDQLMQLSERIGSTDYQDQLRRTKAGIPYARNVVDLGYREAIRRASGNPGNLTSG